MPKDTSGRPWAVTALPGIIKRTLETPTAASVHKLRTTIRRLETLLVSTGADAGEKKLLKQVGRMRKAAGHVRDVDVHLSILQRLDRRGVASDYAELTDHLKKRRSKREKKLVATLMKQLDAGVLKKLKQVGNCESHSTSASTVSVNEIASQFLSKAVPLPAEDGLHAFRLKCKHLRYSAELMQESPERDTLIGELKKVQDAIGAWHDVLTLRSAAEDLLGTTRPIISLIRTLAQSRLNEAQRTVSKAAVNVRHMTEPLLRKPAKSQPPQRMHQIATA